MRNNARLWVNSIAKAKITRKKVTRESKLTDAAQLISIGNAKVTRESKLTDDAQATLRAISAVYSICFAQAPLVRKNKPSVGRLVIDAPVLFVVRIQRITCRG